MKTFILISDKSQWMHSLETATMKFTNPITNRAVSIDKRRIDQLITSDKELVLKLINQPEGEVKVTYIEAKRLLELDKVMGLHWTLFKSRYTDKN